MIYYAVTREGRFGIENCLGSEWGEPLADRIQTIPYDDLFRRRAIPRGTWIFSDLDHLTPAGVEIATRIWDTLADAGHTLLNHPARVLHRYELLTTLHATGDSRVRVLRATESRTALRFPVFLREEEEHTGGLTGLIESAGALRWALFWARLHGYRRSRLLVVEFCDTSDREGLFRKYSAYYLAGRVLPRHLQASREWAIKVRVGELDDAYAEEERRYIEENPHADWIARMCKRAHIDYGRIDYSVYDDSPQIWEINTNPTIGPGQTPRPRTPELDRYRELQEPGKKVFHEGFRQAFESVDSEASGELSVSIPSDLLDTWQREHDRRQRARVRPLKRRETLDRMTAVPVVRTVWPKVKSAGRRVWARWNRRRTT